MVTSADSQITSDDAAQAIAPRRTRIDNSHPIASDSTAAAADSQPDESPILHQPALLEIEEEPSAEMIAAVAGESPEIRREQVQLQVAQLAGHLRERLREVDRREAAVNARSGQLESDVRASRMWLREREVEFQERENELRRQIEELQEQAHLRSGPRDEPEAEQPLDLETRLAEFAVRERQLVSREDDIRERRFEIERLAAAVRHGQQLWEQQRAQQERDLALSRDELTAEFDARCQEREAAIQSGEAMLVEHALQLDREREALQADRRAWEQQRAREREAIEDLRRSAEGELADRRTRLEARHDWIEQQRAGLERVRDEALSLHRQSLEMRLVAEQLWAQISSRQSPAEVTQSLAQSRLKLAEQYRMEQDQLESQKQELVTLGERIAAQHRELVQLRDGIRDWATARQGEIERQAAALVQRERALDSKEESFRQAQLAWQSDRRRYEKQIRELSQCSRPLPAAA